VQIRGWQLALALVGGDLYTPPPMLLSAQNPRLPRFGKPMLLVLLLVFLTAPGCVRRRLTVRTNPPGALVYVDNQQIGTTPCSVDFTYYGTREIRMVKPGYETLTVNQPIPTPWYETPGIDFISENLVPLKIRDNRNVAFNLSPQRLVPNEELIGRGQQLRAQAQAPVVPAGAAFPISTGPTPRGPVGDPFLVAPPIGSLQAPPPTAQPPGSQPFAAPGSTIAPLQQPLPQQPLAPTPAAPQPFTPFRY